MALPAEILDLYDRRSKLLCYPEGTADDEVAGEIDDWHRGLIALEYEWSLEAPGLVDETHEGDRTVGVVIALLPPIDRQGHAIPRVIDARLLADVELLVREACRLTRSSDLELAFELDEVVVGWVEAGAADRQLAEGLLRPWQERVRTPN